MQSVLIGISWQRELKFSKFQYFFTFIKFSQIKVCRKHQIYYTQVSIWHLGTLPSKFSWMQLLWFSKYLNWLNPSLSPGYLRPNKPDLKGVKGKIGRVYAIYFRGWSWPSDISRETLCLITYFSRDSFMAF